MMMMMPMRRSEAAPMTTVPTDIVAGAPLWPCGDALDQRLTKIALPCIANFAINPLVGAVDLFWVNRMVSLICLNSRCMDMPPPHTITKTREMHLLLPVKLPPIKSLAPPFG